MEETKQEDETSSPSELDSRHQLGDPLEQRVTGGRWGWGQGGRPSCRGPPAGSDGSLSGHFESMPRSKYVRAALPVAAFLGFPVASLVDVDLLPCGVVLTALEPKRLVAFMRCTWKRKTRKST